jgi:hypothetical protein
VSVSQPPRHGEASSHATTWGLPLSGSHRASRRHTQRAPPRTTPTCASRLDGVTTSHPPQKKPNPRPNPHLRPRPKCPSRRKSVSSRPHNPRTMPMTRTPRLTRAPAATSARIPRHRPYVSVGLSPAYPTSMHRTSGSSHPISANSHTTWSAHTSPHPPL